MRDSENSTLDIGMEGDVVREYGSRSFGLGGSWGWRGSRGSATPPVVWGSSSA
jgi:hypothetical protein